MRSIFTLMLGVVFVASSFTPAGNSKSSLEIGKPAPLADRKMKSTSGNQVSLKEVMNDNGLLVIFSCNTCPFVVGKENSDGWQGRYNEVFELAKKNEVGGILVNSNKAKRTKGDSFEDMVRQSDKQQYAVDYVLDTDHVLADAFGAKTTPHVFLFDRNYKLVYKGAIDDNNASASEVEHTWLKDAIVNTANSKAIDPNKTKAIGCSIKRVSK